jgi:hypothetical protein
MVWTWCDMQVVYEVLHSNATLHTSRHYHYVLDQASGKHSICACCIQHTAWLAYYGREAAMMVCTHE